MHLDTAFHPETIHPTAFIAPGAIVVGAVTLGEQASVWFNATLRGDVEALLVGPRSNIQEGCILHADPGYPTVIGADVTVGHGAVVHGARVGDNCIVGIRAVLLNGSVVGENSIVGACALLTEGKVYPPNSLILGMPARVVRELAAEEIEANRSSAARYVERAAAFSEAGSVFIDRYYSGQCDQKTSEVAAALNWAQFRANDQFNPQAATSEVLG